jgi:hypothetical protein
MAQAFLASGVSKFQWTVDEGLVDMEEMRVGDEVRW